MALIVSNTLGFGGEQMRLAAQSWWILDEGGSKTEMGLAAGLRFIPIVIITLYAGVMIDRIGGKRVLILERSFLVILSLVTAFVLFSDQVQIWHIVVLTAIAGTTIAMGYPSTQSLVPQVAPKELFQSANSMNHLGNALGRTLGPLLAGILIAIKDAAVAFIGLAVVYAVSALANIRHRHENSPVLGIWIGNRPNSRRATVHQAQSHPDVGDPDGLLSSFLVVLFFRSSRSTLAMYSTPVKCNLDGCGAHSQSVRVPLL